MGGDAKFNFDENYTFASDTVTWMIRGYTKLGRLIARDLEIEPRAKALIDAGEFEQFAETYGTEMVLEEHRGAQIVALFSLRNISEQQKSRLETSFEGSYGWGFFKAEAQASYREFISGATRAGALSVEVFALGGEGISKLARALDPATDLNTISKLLVEYCANFTFKNGTTFEYYTGSVKSFRWRGHSWETAYRDTFMGELYFIYKDAAAT
jgi:hypothetical protein